MISEATGDTGHPFFCASGHLTTASSLECQSKKENGFNSSDRPWRVGVSLNDVTVLATSPVVAADSLSQSGGSRQAEWR